MKKKKAKVTELSAGKVSYKKGDDFEIFRQSPICSNCVNYIVTNLFDETHKFQKKCGAFPKGIPDEIWSGKNDHTSPFEGDNGIQFTKPTKPKVVAILKDYISKGGVATKKAQEILDTIESAG